MEFKLIGYDYTNQLNKKVAVDPETKALLTKSVSEPYSGIINASEYDTLQEAIDAAYAIGYNFVFIPGPGTYDITAPLSLPADGFSLIGAGRKIVTLRATSSMDAVIKQVGKRYLTVGGFRVDGNGDLASNGLWLENVVWFSKFFDIEIRDIATSALYLANAGGTIGYAPLWNLFQNIQCGRVQDRGTHGIHLRGDANANTFINCTAAGDDFGILLQNYDFGASGVRGPGSNVFIIPDCGGSATCVGIKIENSAGGNTFFNPYVEGVLRSMEILVKDNVVIGGTFYGNTNNEILAPNGLDCYYYKIGANTYGSWKGAGGAGGREKQDLLVKVHLPYPYSTYQIDIDAAVLQVENENLTGIDLTVDITQSGANGLDIGEEAANTWYSIWVIRGTSGTAGLFSISPTSPSMPAGYTKKRRVGWVRNKSNSDFRGFFHIGDWWHWDIHHTPLDTASGATVWTDVNCAAYAPPTCEVLVIGAQTRNLDGPFTRIDIRRNGTLEDGSTHFHLGGGQSVAPTWGLSTIGMVVSCDGDQIIEYRLAEGGDEAAINIEGYYDPI